MATLGGGILTCFDLGAATSMGVASFALSTAGVLSAASSISPDDESCRRMTMCLQKVDWQIEMLTNVRVRVWQVSPRQV